jgi:hypothetical protein
VGGRCVWLAQRGVLQVTECKVGKGVLRGVSDIVAVAPSSSTGASARAIGGGVQGYPSGEERGPWKLVLNLNRESVLHNRLGVAQTMWTT